MHRSFFDLVQKIKKQCTETERKIQNDLQLTQAEFTALRLIRPGEKMQSGFFSEKMDLSVSRGSRVINQLRAKGYVRVLPVPGNRRCRHVVLTSKGEKIQDEMYRQILRCEEAFLSHLSPGTRVQVFDNLEELVAIMEGDAVRN